MAVIDTKFRILLAAIGLAFFGVGYPLYVVLDSGVGFLIGEIVEFVGRRVNQPLIGSTGSVEALRK